MNDRRRKRAWARDLSAACARGRGWCRRRRRNLAGSRPASRYRNTGVPSCGAPARDAQKPRAVGRASRATTASHRLCHRSLLKTWPGVNVIGRSAVAATGTPMTTAARDAARIGMRRRLTRASRASGCEVCHRARFTTGEALEPVLTGQLIWPYTDLLLHDMGEGLDDGLDEGDAAPGEWRPPCSGGSGSSRRSTGPDTCCTTGARTVSPTRSSGTGAKHRRRETPTPLCRSPTATPCTPLWTRCDAGEFAVRSDLRTVLRCAMRSMKRCWIVVAGVAAPAQSIAVRSSTRCWPGASAKRVTG